MAAYLPPGVKNKPLVKPTSPKASPGWIERSRDKLEFLHDFFIDETRAVLPTRSKLMLPVLIEVYDRAWNLRQHPNFYFSSKMCAARLDCAAQSVSRIMRFLQELGLVTLVSRSQFNPKTGSHSAPKYMITKNNIDALLELLEDVWQLRLPEAELTWDEIVGEDEEPVLVEELVVEDIVKPQQKPVKKESVHIIYYIVYRLINTYNILINNIRANLNLYAVIDPNVMLLGP